jgi:hypothetical protein
MIGGSLPLRLCVSLRLPLCLRLEGCMIEYSAPVHSVVGSHLGGTCAQPHSVARLSRCVVRIDQEEKEEKKNFEQEFLGREGVSVSLRVGIGDPVAPPLWRSVSATEGWRAVQLCLCEWTCFFTCSPAW